IKVLIGTLDETSIKQFKEEAQRLSDLQHPHIVAVYDFSPAPEPYLAMTYAENGTLRQRHKRGSIVPIELVVQYIKQVAEALQYSHDQGLIHRDVKPENLLLSTSGNVLLSDFGIVALAQNSTSQKTVNVAGSASYMAPEQIMGKPRFASDQYAVAVMAYEWLCGTLPFVGDNFHVVYFGHLHREPKPLHEIVATTSCCRSSRTACAAKRSEAAF
ncbi:MAG TPA: serine/threonine-protein kinase, partial [Candidatus Acidoferrum sp.]|nr:serine/threonine-protein kinase [Candidatus Acidoferrum sp.]